MKGLRWSRAGLRTGLASPDASPWRRRRSPPTAPPPENPKAERVTVTDPYIEMRTGPGRGYPIFFVAARGEQIDIELRHTDWFRVRTDGGKVGWVHRGQLETTLTASGQQKSFRDILVDDYLNRKLQLGFAWGQFKSEPMLKVWGSYRLSETLSIEATLGQVQGVFSGTDFWHVNLARRAVERPAAVALLRHRRRPLQQLPEPEPGRAPTRPTPTSPTPRIGVRYYLTDRFVLRADYSLYTVFVNDCEDQGIRRLERRRLLLLLGRHGRSDARTHESNKTCCIALSFAATALPALAQSTAPARAAPASRWSCRRSTGATCAMPQLSVERLRGRPLHRRLRDRELRHQLGLRRAHRLPPDRGLLRPGRVRADQGHATRPSGRSCRAASSNRRRRSSTTTTSRSATTSCPARCSCSRAGPGRRSSTSSAASAAPSSSTSASPPSTSASASASS